MPLVHPIPPEGFWASRRFRASAFDADILRAWAKRCRAAGCEYWLYRGKLVSQAAISVYGVSEALERA